MSQELVEKIEKINKTINDKQVEKNSCERQADDVKTELKELTETCQNDFELKPEELAQEIEKLESSMGEIIKELEGKLNE